ncbi:hypothetical protein Efla_004796 [Eimeria flavescens]
MMQRCSSSSSNRGAPQLVWRPLRWRLRPPKAGSNPESPSSSSSSSSSSSEEGFGRDSGCSRVCCISGVAMGGPLSRGALSRVCAAASLEAPPRPLVMKRYLLHELKRLRTACFLAGDVQVQTEWERVKCEVLLHASLRHPLICPLQGLIVDQAGGLLLLLLPRRPHTLQRWDARACCFVLLPQQLQQLQQQQQQQEEQHRCGAGGRCGCKKVLLYSEEGARILLRQLVEAASALHALRVVHKDIKPSNVLLLRRLPASFGCAVWVPPPQGHLARGGDGETIPGGDGEADGLMVETDGEGDSSAEEEEDAAADSFLFAGSPTTTIPRAELQPLAEALKATDACPLPPVPIAAAAAGAAADAAATPAAGSLAECAAAAQQEEGRVPLAEALRGRLLDRLAFPRHSSSSASDDASSSSSSSGSEDEGMQQQQQQQQEEGQRGTRKRQRRAASDSSEAAATNGNTNNGLPAAAAADANGSDPLKRSSSSSNNSSSSRSETEESAVLLQLTDFNSAAVADDDACTIWDAAGSPHFVSPECLGTTEGGGTDGRARDMWAIGTSLFCMLFGRPPFWGSRGIELACRLMSEEILLPPWRTAAAASGPSTASDGRPSAESPVDDGLRRSRAFPVCHGRSPPLSKAALLAAAAAAAAAARRLLQSGCRGPIGGSQKRAASTASSQKEVKLPMQPHGS